ncbi:MAG: YtxH domain-containing protein [Anaerolineales bacterium]|jgi:gas vesicle protein
MRRALGFLIGVTLGGMTGAILALLFTPLSGADLRTQLNDRTAGLAAEVRQAANTKRIELTERLETLRTPRA